MTEPFIGEIRAFAFDFAPDGWLACDGAEVSIAQYQSLYSVIGSAYGNATATTFILPNFQGSAPVGAGTGPGLSAYVLGKQMGSPAVILTPANLPAHNHQARLRLSKAGTGKSYATVPTAKAYLGPDFTSINSGSTINAIKEFLPAANTSLAEQAIGAEGQGKPHENRQPFLALNFCIAYEGEYPIRP